MRALILAAGQGRRLGCRSRPKCLTPLVDGQTILGYQCRALQEYLAADRITVTVGFGEKWVREAFPKLSYATLPHYDEVNTAASLLVGLKEIVSRDEKDDLLLLNGDVVFAPEVIRPLIEREGNLIGVNRAQVGDEEMKYRTDSDGAIIALSKDLKEPEGEALGVNRLSAGILPKLIEALEVVSPKAYFEEGLVKLIAEGVVLFPFPIGEEECVEIDFPADLERANRLIAGMQRADRKARSTDR